jgi:quercetin 2,3-dioxygenase
MRERAQRNCDLSPGYEQRHFTEIDMRDHLRFVGEPDAKDGAITIHQDVRLYAACLNTDHTIEHVIAPNRGAWVQLARGAAMLNGHEMKEGDGAALDDEDTVQITAQVDSEVLLFDLK